jgi:hypothetical protein
VSTVAPTQAGTASTAAPVAQPCAAEAVGADDGDDDEDEPTSSGAGAMPPPPRLQPPTPPPCTSAPDDVAITVDAPRSTAAAPTCDAVVPIEDACEAAVAAARRRGSGCAALLSSAVLTALYYPAAFMRRAWFLRPAFGRDRSTWAGSFAVGASVQGTIRALRRAPPPPLLLVNAQWDLGLEAHTDLFHAQLLAAAGAASTAGEEGGGAIAGAGMKMGPGIIVERIALLGANHIDYVLGMDRTGWAGEEVALPAVVSFLRRHMAPAPPTCRAAPAGGSVGP